MRRILVFTVLICWQFANAAVAANCGSSATQSDLNDCAATDFRVADAALNTTYKEIVSRLRDREDVRHLLTDAEKLGQRFAIANACLPPAELGAAVFTQW